MHARPAPQPATYEVPYFCALLGEMLGQLQLVVEEGAKSQLSESLSQNRILVAQGCFWKSRRHRAVWDSHGHAWPAGCQPSEQQLQPHPLAKATLPGSLMTKETLAGMQGPDLGWDIAKF